MEVEANSLWRPSKFADVLISVLTPLLDPDSLLHLRLVSTEWRRAVRLPRVYLSFDNTKAATSELSFILSQTSAISVSDFEDKPHPELLSAALLHAASLNPIHYSPTKKLRISGCSFSSAAGVQRWADCVRLMPHLAKYSSDFNYFHSTSLPNVASSLASLPNLTDLRFHCDTPQTLEGDEEERSSDESGGEGGCTNASGDSEPIPGRETASQRQFFREISLCSKLKKFAFTGSAWNSGILDDIAVVVRSCGSLRYLDLSQMHGSSVLDISVLASEIGRHSSLKTLDLSDNAFNDLGVLFAALETNGALQNLSVARCGSLGDSTGETLGRMLRFNSTLQSLDLSATNPLSVGALSHISMALQYRNATITCLDVSNCRLVSSAIPAVSDLISRCSSLRSLEIHSNQFESSDYVTIVEALLRNTTFCRFKFDHCSVDPEVIGKLIMESTTLTELYVMGTSISDMSPLGRALSTNRFLRTLGLAENEQVLTGWAQVAGSLRVNTTLERLKMPSCNLQSADGLAFASALVENRTLRHLDLCYNEMSGAAVDALRDVARTTLLSLEATPNFDQL